LDVRGHFLMVVELITLTVGGKWLVDGAIKWMAMILFEKQIKYYMRQKEKGKNRLYICVGKKQMVG